MKMKPVYFSMIKSQVLIIKFVRIWQNFFAEVLTQEIGFLDYNDCEYQLQKLQIEGFSSETKNR